jgi:hypothetical protein
VFFGVFLVFFLIVRKDGKTGRNKRYFAGKMALYEEFATKIE